MQGRSYRTTEKAMISQGFQSPGYCRDFTGMESQLYLLFYIQNELLLTCQNILIGLFKLKSMTIVMIHHCLEEHFMAFVLKLG